MQSNLDLHKAYIQGWAQAIKDAPKVLFDAIKDAEQISDYLIDKGEFRQVIEAEQVKEAQEPGAMEEASRDHGEETVKQITVLVVEPGKVPYTKEIGDDWRAFQAEVGGTFQIIYPGYDPVGLVCNDDGKLLGLPLNRGLLDDDGEPVRCCCRHLFPGWPRRRRYHRVSDGRPDSQVRAALPRSGTVYQG